jgi:predicted RNA methylase
MPETSPRSLAAALRARQSVPDLCFDRVYPAHVRVVSARYWTPVHVALLGAGWLRGAGCQRLLDVGAGPGKFCIVSCLAAGCSTLGIEQRPQLVELARAAACAYEAQADFELGTIEQIDPERFDAWYFYNPFGENAYDGADRFDNTVELSDARCARDLTIVEGWLDRAARGTCVLTYHGFGGRMPDTYALVRRQYVHGGELRLWIKRRPGRAQGFSMELGESIYSSEQLEAMAPRLSASCHRRVRELLARPFT